MMEKAYFAGGCFWCISPIFRQMEGVRSVVSGYSGGDEIDPTYEDVKNQRTGHRETICIEFDPEKAPFRELLQMFLYNVDPFDEGGQFIDRGFSYTLAVYHLNDHQKAVTEEMLEILAQEAGRTPFIAVESFKNFYIAEEYHQNYDLKNPIAFHRELVESGRIKE
jgi:peptide-methionine (S)-S-oxide reductase